MSTSMNKRKVVLHGQELKCKNGCGFFGNPEWQGYCSKCHRELNQKIKPEPTKGPAKKVARSYSDAHESPLSLGFSKFEEKKKQQSEKRSKTIKSIIKRGGTSKDSVTHSPSRELFTFEEITQLSRDFQLKDAATKDVFKYIHNQLDLMSKHYDKSVDEQSEVMQDFYNFMTNRFEMHPHYQDLSPEQIDQLLDKIEEKLMSYMHRSVFTQISTEYEDKDLAMQKRIRSFNWITAQLLGLDITENNPEVRDLIDKAITDVIEMDSKIAPQDKINCIVNCSKNILNIINLCQGVTVSADEFLPAMVYIVLKANPPLLQSNIKYITSYSIPARLRSGEGAYYFTNLCCAVAHIEDLKADDLNLSKDEFERYMSGEIPVGYAEQSITTCEGLRLMSQNLATLSEIQEKNNQVLNGMLTLKEEMTKFEETILKIKPTTLLKISPTPYMIAAHVDMSLIPEILRNRVCLDESGELLVDLDSKVANGEETIALPSDLSVMPRSFDESNTLADFHNISLDCEPNSLASITQTVMQPLRVSLPDVDLSCDYISSASTVTSSGQDCVTQTVLNIKDLQYPTEIFPDVRSEVNALDSLDSVSNVVDINGGCLLDPEAGIMEEMPPPLLNLPPPLQPIVMIQSNKSENDKHP